MDGNCGVWILNSRELTGAMARIEALISLGGIPPDDLPVTLRLKDIQTEETLFQPRDSLHEKHYKRDSERHVNEMAHALRNSPLGQRTLEPIVVVSLGNQWFCIDGHHRLKAYAAAAIFNDLPVTVFSLEASGKERIKWAMHRATELNVREKLPMTGDDRSNSAWRLCVLGGSNGSKVALITGLSRRTIANMRRALGALRKGETSQSELYALSWRQALWQSRNVVAERPLGDYDDKIEQMAEEMAERLRKTFALRLDNNPAVTARAIQIYSSRLPARLVDEWGPELLVDDETEEDETNE